MCLTVNEDNEKVLISQIAESSSIQKWAVRNICQSLCLSVCMCVYVSVQKSIFFLIIDGRKIKVQAKQKLHASVTVSINVIRKISFTEKGFENLLTSLETNEWVRIRPLFLKKGGELPSSKLHLSLSEKLTSHRAVRSGYTQHSSLTTWHTAICPCGFYSIQAVQWI